MTRSPAWLWEAPEASEALARAFASFAARIEPGCTLLLPPVAGVEPLVVARWLYRAWAEAHPGAGPFLHLGAAAAEAAPPALLALAGWLYVEGAAPAGPRRVTLGAGAGEPLELPAAERERLRALDRVHAVGGDPALADLRRSLLSHCRSASVLHLTGPPGVESVALAAWAHAAAGERGLSHLRRGGARRPSPGQWQLYEEPAELEPDQLHHLRQRLEAGARPATLPPDPELGAARPDLPAFAPILGRSASLGAVLARAARVAPSPLSVLILGESGTGKESLARAIHDASGRRGPYRVADVATLAEELVESELFGHKRGAFTGAVGDRLGAFRSADGGTLFLDELGNLPPRIQAKLLRALQEKVVQPVGEDRTWAVDVRIVAATNADLDAMVRRGDFREDLLRRLEAVTLRLPPLRERGEDVLLLARSFARRAGAVADPWITPEARALLLAHDWPGNVRELGNIVAQAVAEAGREAVRPEDLGPLAPANRRPVPVFVTTTEGESDQPAGLDRPLLQRLRAVTLRVPALRDRGEASLRHAVFSRLEGRPIEPEALRLLCARPWWGNLPELDADLAAVRANLPGLVELGSLRRLLPHLLQGGSAEPLRALLNPVLQADGRVTGLVAEHPSAALLVGRQPAPPAGGPRPALLALPWFPRLSRAHALVTRGPEGLVVRVLDAARHPLRVTPLATGRGVWVSPGEETAVGPAGELALDGVPPLQLYVFAGSVAFEEHAPTAAARVLPAGAATAVAPEEPVPTPAPEAPGPRAGVFVLDPPEVAALVQVVARYRGGSFHEALVSGLGAVTADPELTRLCTFVLGPRPTQYCARLFEHAGNGALREALREALAALPDGPARLDALPLGIRRSLSP